MPTNTEVHVRLPTDLHAALVKLAREEARSLNGQIVYLLRKAIEQPAK